MNSNKDISVVVDNYLCFGCGTCNVVCPKDAISMGYDNIGRISPVIDYTKCIKCSLCYENCPSIDLKKNVITTIDGVENYEGNIKNVYLGRSTDEEIYNNSQSGGIVTSILLYLFDNNLIDAAIVCKSNYGNRNNIEPFIATNRNELIKHQKSKYAPVDMVSAMKKTESFSSIAFVGTGCHIEGVRTLSKFSKKYSNIKYCIGLICDRTLCNDAGDILLSEMNSTSLKRIIWRDKSENYQNANILITNKSGKTKRIPKWKRFALKEPFTNPRCRICFDKLNILADFVVGDPHGMVGNIDWEHGTSVVVARNDIADNILRQMEAQNYITIEKSDKTQLINGQHIYDRYDINKRFLKVYSHNKWLVPSYYGPYVLSCQEPLEKDLHIVSEFQSDSKLDYDVIIAKYKKYLKNKSFNQNIIRLKTSLIKVLKRIVKW